MTTTSTTELFLERITLWHKGLWLHNSLEQDADMVILLHRPDAFDRDDPRGGEADLILGKHRNGPTKTITVAHQLHLSRFTNMAH